MGVVSKDYTPEQKQIFDECVSGDIVYAICPGTEEQLQQMDSNHIRRPYLVAKKGKDYLVVYTFSSVKRMGLKPYDYFKQRFMFSHESKPSYIYLFAYSYLPIQNIIRHNGHLNETILGLLEKRTVIANRKRTGKRPRFNVPIVSEPGDIIACRYQIYLVVDKNDKGIYAVPINNHSAVFYRYQNDAYTYFIDYLHPEKIGLDEKVYFLDMIPKTEVRYIHHMNTRYRKNHGQYYYIFPLGTTFYCGMYQYLYLYNYKGRCYGVQNDGQFIVDPLNYTYYMQLGDRLNRDEFVEVLNHLVNLNHDPHRVLAEMISEVDGYYVYSYC